MFLVCLVLNDVFLIVCLQHSKPNQQGHRYQPEESYEQFVLF